MFQFERLILKPAFVILLFLLCFKTPQNDKFLSVSEIDWICLKWCTLIKLATWWNQHLRVYIQDVQSVRIVRCDPSSVLISSTLSIKYFFLMVQSSYLFENCFIMVPFKLLSTNVLLFNNPSSPKFTFLQKLKLISLLNNLFFSPFSALIKMERCLKKFTQICQKSFLVELIRNC